LATQQEAQKKGEKKKKKNKTKMKRECIKANDGLY